MKSRKSKKKKKEIKMKIKRFLIYSVKAQMREIEITNLLI